MPLKNPDLEPETYGLLDEISVSLVRIIRHHYTSGTADEAIHALMPVLGREWRNRLILALVSGTSDVSRIQVRLIDRDAYKGDYPTGSNIGRKVKAIKALRSITGWGLTQSKGFIEAAETQTMSAEVRSFEINDVDDQIPEARIRNAVQDLRYSGFSVELL
jgi:hypothetical protein